MVEKFKKILTAIRAKGTISLFAILRMDDLTDKWTVLVSAPWEDEEKRREFFEELVDMIKQTMTEEEAASIARVLVSNKENHLVQKLLEQKAGAHIVGAMEINGNLVHEAYILESNKGTGEKEIT